MNFFVTGTDTDVGKSYICRHLAREFIQTGKKTGYLKPFQSGIEKGIDSDTNHVAKTASAIEARSSYTTKTPCTPWVSAQIDGIKLEIEKVKNDYENLSQMCDITIVEGSGGLYVPVEKNILMSNVIKELELPALIVARPNLGTINHTLMTVKCAEQDGINVLGVVISNYPADTNNPAILKAKDMIESFCDTKVLALIHHNQTDLSELAEKLI